MFSSMGRTKKIIFAIQVTVIVLCAGIWGGIQIETARANRQNSIEAGYDTQVAVVNLDEGAIVDGEMVYYSTAFLNSLSSNFVPVAAGTAREGLESGTYGAVITIPADLSIKVRSINSQNPAKIALQYEINNKLPEEKYIAVYEAVYNVQAALNNSFSYVYMASILNQVHRGQDNAKLVFENDRQSLAESNRIKQTNFMKGLKATPYPQIDSQLDSIDFSGLNNQLLGYGATLDVSYQQLYAAALAQYGAEEQAIADSALNITDEAAAWAGDVKAVAEAVQRDMDKLDAYKNDLDAYKNDLDGYKNDLDAYKNDLDGYKNDLDAWAQGGAAGNQPQEPAASSPEFEGKSVDKPALENPAAPEVSNPELDAAVADIQAKVTDHLDKVAMYKDPATVANIQNAQTLITNEVNSFAQRYATVTNDNLAKMNKGIDDAQKYAADVYSNVNRQYTEEQKMLEDTLNSFYSSQHAKSAENQELLEEFVSMLPNSQDKGLLNEVFVEFAIAPVELSGSAYRPVVDTVATSRQRTQTVIFIVTIAILLAALVTLFTSMKKREREHSKALAWRR